MRLVDGLHDAFRYRATIHRLSDSGGNLRYQPILVNWACDVAHIRREDVFRDAFTDATHVLTGIVLNRAFFLQAGDQVVSILTPGGVELVRPNKEWQVVGRRHYPEAGDLTHQTVYVKENI